MDLATIEFRKKVDQLQAGLLVHPNRVEEKLEHFFAHGLYGRQLFIPKGTAYVGKIHRFSHFRFVLGGHLLIVTETGNYECRAPHFMITPAQTRRIGYAYQDTIVMTIHATENTDVEEIEREIIMPRSEQLTMESI